MSRSLLVRCAVVLVAVFGGGCPPSDTGGTGGDGLDTDVVKPGTAPPVTAVVDGTYSDQARTIPADTITNNLRSVSTDGAQYRFDDTAADAAALVPGDVVIFTGRGLRRVTAVSVEGGEVVVDTTSATLNEAIRDGRVSWNAPVSFATAALPELDGDADASWSVVKETTAQSTSLKQKFSGTVGGWQVSVEYEPTPDRLNVTLKCALKAGNLDVGAVSGKGWIGNFTHSADLQYAQGELTQMELNNTGIAGEAEVRWAAFNEKGNPIIDIVQLKIPVSLPVPIDVAGIPMVLKIKATGRIVPELRTDQTSSAGSFKVVFNSVQGFQITSSSGSPTATPVGQLNSADLGVNGETVSAGPELSTGLGFGFEFPRFELSLPGEVAMAFVTVDTYSFSLFRPGLLSGEQSCQCGGMRFKAITGFKLSFFGLAGYENQFEIWKQDFDSCLNNVPCD